MLISNGRSNTSLECDKCTSCCTRSGSLLEEPLLGIVEIAIRTGEGSTRLKWKICVRISEGRRRMGKADCIGMIGQVNDDFEILQSMHR